MRTQLEAAGDQLGGWRAGRRWAHLGDQWEANLEG